MRLFTDFEPCESNSVKDLVVFLHGWGMHGGIWSQVVSLLKQDFHCLSLDLPGMGRSPIPNGNYELTQVAELCALELSEYQHFNIHCVGWSLGAIVMHRLAQLEKFYSLTTVAMGPWFLQEIGRKWSDKDLHLGMPKAEFDYFKALFFEDMEGTVYRFLGLNTKGSRSQRQELRVLQQLVNCFGLPAPKALSRGLDILGEANIVSGLQSKHCPQLMVFGENDSLVPVNFVPWVEKAAPYVECQVMKGAGHIPFLTDPKVFVENLREFILRIKESSATV